MREPLDRITGQAGDEVHIDVVVPGGARRMETVDDILRGVLAADAAQHLVGNVCGLMEMRVAPYCFRMRSLSGPVQSGRPASTVYSSSAARSNVAAMCAMSCSSCAAERLVGVPPPMYSVRMRSPQRSAVWRMAVSSWQSLST